MVNENKLYDAPFSSNYRVAFNHRLRRRNPMSEHRSETPLETSPMPTQDKNDTPQLDHVDTSIVSKPAGSETKSLGIKEDTEHSEVPPEKFCKICMRFIYDKQKKAILGRTCNSWFWITLYSVMYLIGLITYTMIFVALTLLLVRKITFKDLSHEPIISNLKYSPDSVELIGIPLAEHSFPLIWYRSGEGGEYMRYITALDEMLHKDRAKRQLSSRLGPCGQRPYGYGDKPCVLVKIDQQTNWVGKPLQTESLTVRYAPMEVQKWIKRDSTKYWLHCAGNHNYDQEHLGQIIYFPDPPGFDSFMFPMDENSTSEVIAVQLTNFSLGISLEIECKLWFEDGITSFAFMLYVLP